jgi:hypothetical protein
MKEFTYQCWQEDSLTFLNKADSSNLNLPEKCIDFLVNVGLPKYVDCFDMNFDLGKVKMYRANYDYPKDPIEPIEIVYEIGIYTMEIGIQASDGSVWLFSSRALLPGSLATRHGYYNLDIECFAKCLDFYEYFFREHPLDVLEKEPSQAIRTHLFETLRKRLASIDKTIIGPDVENNPYNPFNLEYISYDDIWAYELEALYHLLDIEDEGLD